LSLRGTSYPRGGGESGTEDVSSGEGLNESVGAAALVDAITDAGGASTAAGPISDSTIAASGSAALRHVQE
jgi:hypothetical protein